jgi:hypothetical protein
MTVRRYRVHRSVNLPTEVLSSIGPISKHLRLLCGKSSKHIDMARDMLHLVIEYNRSKCGPYPANPAMVAQEILAVRQVSIKQSNVPVSGSPNWLALGLSSIVLGVVLTFTDGEQHEFVRLHLPSRKPVDQVCTSASTAIFVVQASSGCLWLVSYCWPRSQVLFTRRKW